MQIHPLRIQRLDQRDLPLPRPGFDLLLALDRGGHLTVKLIPNEQLASVPRGEPDRAVLVLPNSRREIRGDTRVKRAIAPVRHDVDRRLLHTSRLASPSLREA